MKKTLITKGSLTLEVLIAFSFLAATVTSTILLSVGTQTTVGNASAALAQLFSETSTLTLLHSTLSHSLYTSASTTTHGAYTDSFVSPCVSRIESFADSRAHTLIGSLVEAQKMGEACDPFPPQDSWEHFSRQIPFGIPEASSTDSALHTIHGTPYLFVTAAAENSTLPDLFVFDITDKLNPLLVTATDTGNGINGIEIVGPYAYILNNANTEQLYVFSVSDPKNLVHIATVSFPNITFSCSPTTDICTAGKSIYYYDGRIYIGTDYLAFGATPAHNNEFHVYCVHDPGNPSCSPETPQWLGSLNVNHSVRDILVQNNMAYLATSDDTGELMIVDISNPTHLLHPDITHMKFDARTTSGGASTEDGRSIFVLGNMLYLGRQRVNSANERTLYALDVSKPGAIEEKYSASISLHKAAEFISDIVAQGDLLFVSSTDHLQPLSVFRVSSTGLTAQTACGTPGSAEIYKLLYQDNTLFSVDRKGPLFRFFTHSTSCS